MFAHSKGRMAEWLGSGLQNHLHRFESGSDLNLTAFVFLIETKSYQQKTNNFPLYFNFFYLT